ncbi:Carboxylic ester hydrolase [Fusarium sp. LHS14.1]|nr:Carboxylic ester hydrolase [Fusarium sp. LHS14.1]
MILSLLSALCLGLPLSYAYPCGTRYYQHPIVTLADGIVMGKASQVPSAPHLTVHQYLGVPFAESPPKRFAPPEDPAPWNSSWDASYFRPSCIQHFPGDDFRAIFNTPPLPESEDCLYLNVFTPSNKPSEGLPVLFWIHGGSFSLGSARVPDFDGSSFAANQGVVVVTINYRINVFGFPGSSAIPLEQRNIGLMDQRKALSWVNKNIRAFGGDPSKVAIFGESAGGWSVKQLLINPPSPPQFRAAILQSQAFGPQADNEKSWDILVEELHCNKSTTTSSDLECVANAEVDSIQRVLQSRGLAFTPILDNSTNGPVFLDAVNQNLTAQVPILVGTNADEGTVLASVMSPPELLLDGIFGNDTASKRLARSAYLSDATDDELKSLITTDYTYTCTTSMIARTAASAGQRVWRYYFNASFPSNQPFPGAGVWHTSEIPLVFGTYKEDNRTSTEQRRLSRTMQQAWGDFAKSPELGPGWAAVGTGTNDLRLFDAGEAIFGQSLQPKVVDNVCTYYDAELIANGF